MIDFRKILTECYPKKKKEIRDKFSNFSGGKARVEKGNDTFSMKARERDTRARWKNRRNIKRHVKARKV